MQMTVMRTSFMDDPKRKEKISKSNSEITDILFSVVHIIDTKNDGEPYMYISVLEKLAREGLHLKS